MMDYSLDKRSYRFDLMQYTGRRDKNGLRIYVGDICKLENFYGDKEDALVEIINQGGEYRTFAEDRQELSSSVAGWLIPMEVIGNIFENPELVHDI